jgi:hypothetical protein
VNRRWIAAVVLAAALAVAGWFGWKALNRDRSGAESSVSTATPDAGGDGGAETVETVDTGAATLPTGGTPMAQRVAVVGLLNKRNGESRELTLRPGQAVRLGDAIVRLRACEKTAPWEDEPLTGAFVQLDVHGVDGHWRRVFSGWVYKERPALNVVQHAIYDVWAKSCTMSWPETGPDTVPIAPSAAPGGNASSAKKSPAARGDVPADDAPTTPSSAPDSNAT